MWSLNQVTDFEIEEDEKEIFNKYKHALNYMGVDFEREDIQDAIVTHLFTLEAACQTTIAYWHWKKSQDEELEYPNAFFIDALKNVWKPINWKDEYLSNPLFKSPCTRWWEKCAEVWGTEVRDRLVADVRENERGIEYILFMNERTLSLKVAHVWGWQRVLEYARGDF